MRTRVVLLVSATVVVLGGCGSGGRALIGTAGNSGATATAGRGGSMGAAGRGGSTGDAGRGGSTGDAGRGGSGGSGGSAGTTGSAGVSGNGGGTGGGGGNGGVGGNAAMGGGSGGVGGSAATGGSGGVGGSTGTGGSAGVGGIFGEPACALLRTAAGAEPAKGVACVATDPQFCYRTCGPERTGIKSETCQTSGTYAEMSGCAFDPSKEYSCYKIPASAQAACPVGVTPKGADPCDVPHCTLCNSLQGVTGGQYIDSAGDAKVGWCTCQEPNASGIRTWTCASDTQWPCPLGRGCGGTAGSGGRGGGGAGGASGGSAGGSAGASGNFGEPACLSSVVKGGPCGPTDQQFCYKTCGPERTGVKSETCQTSGTYAEMSGCAFDPSKEYSCYKIPASAQAACPVGVTPKGADPCDVPHCTLCNSLQGVTGGQYIDSAGDAKVGWCTCQLPNSVGIRTWTCASDTQWPCPLGHGC